MSHLRYDNERKELSRWWPSIPIEVFRDHYIPVFDLISVQDANEKCLYPELVEDPLSLELNYSFPLEHVTELIVLGERLSSVAVNKFGVVRKTL